MDLFPNAVRYGVRAGGCGACGFREYSGDFFLAYREVVGKGGEVAVCRGRGRGGREKVVDEGRVDAVGGILIRKGGEAGLLSAACELFCLLYRGRRERGEVFSPVGELSLLDGTKVGPSRSTHGGVVI